MQAPDMSCARCAFEFDTYVRATVEVQGVRLCDHHYDEFVGAPARRHSRESGWESELLDADERRAFAGGWNL